MATILSTERPAVVVIQTEGDIIQTSLDTQTDTVTLDNDTTLAVTYAGFAQVAASNAQASSLAAQNSAVEAEADREIVATHLTTVELHLEAVELHRTTVEGLASQVAIDRQNVQDNTADVITRQSNVQHLHGEVVDLRNQTATDRSYVASVGIQVDADAAQVAADRAQVTSDTAAVAGYRTEVEQDRTDIAGYHADVETDRTEIAGHRATVESLATQVQTHNTAVQDNADQVAAHHLQVSGWRNETEGFRNETEIFRNDAEAAAAAAAGGLRPIGGWDASTNTDPPTPTGGTAPWYRITVAGTVPAVGEVAVGDNIYWSVDQSTWFKIDNTEKFTSINGYTQGEINLTAEDVGAISQSAQGSGGGINADMLDGFDSVAFMRASFLVDYLHNDSYEGLTSSANFLIEGTGPGMTLTRLVNGAYKLYGQHVVPLGSRVLVYSSHLNWGKYNGIYEVTDTGSDTTPYVLTLLGGDDYPNAWPEYATFYIKLGRHANETWMWSGPFPANFGGQRFHMGPVGNPVVQYPRLAAQSISAPYNTQILRITNNYYAESATGAGYSLVEIYSSIAGAGRLFVGKSSSVGGGLEYYGAYGSISSAGGDSLITYIKSGGWVDRTPAATLITEFRHAPAVGTSRLVRGGLGDTATRPTVPAGETAMFFDTTLGRPVFWNGTGWVDATGTAA